MRKVIDLQMEFWKKDIADIEFDLQSRDEIPKLMTGLQYIYNTPALREKVFNVLKRMVPKKNHGNGRPGMDLWKILVLGTLRLNCNWDYDKVHEMANLGLIFVSPKALNRARFSNPLHVISICCGEVANF